MTLTNPQLLTEDKSAASTASYSTAAVKSTKNGRVFVFIVSGKTNGGALAPSSVTHPSVGSLTLVESSLIGTKNVALSVWTGVGSGVSGVFTINFSSAMANCLWQVSEIVSDAGTPNVVQSNSVTMIVSGTHGATMPAAPAITSCVFGVVQYNAATTNVPVPDASYTQLGTRQIGSSPSDQILVAYDNGNATDTANFTVPTNSGANYVTFEVSAPLAPFRATFWNGSTDTDCTLTWWDGTVETPVSFS